MEACAGDAWMEISPRPRCNCLLFWVVALSATKVLCGLIGICFSKLPSGMCSRIHIEWRGKQHKESEVVVVVNPRKVKQGGLHLRPQPPWGRIDLGIHCAWGAQLLWCAGGERRLGSMVLRTLCPDTARVPGSVTGPCWT